MSKTPSQFLLQYKNTEAKNGPVSGSQNFFYKKKFYIFGDIDETLPKNIIAPLIQEIDIRSKQINPEPIEIHISSYGGSVQFAFDIIALIERAKACGVPVYTYVASTACSAASMIAVCGHKRFGSQRAFHLLHFARGWDYSHNPIMIDRNAEHFKWLQTEIIAHYKKYTKITDVAKKMLADNFIISCGAELKRFGLIDEIF